MNATEKDTTYNGWTNYETWLVNLWITNDSDSDAFWRERTAELASTLTVTADMLPYHVADAIEEEFRESNPLSGEASVWSDLMNAALSEVDWSEVAKHLLDSNS